MFFRVFRFFQCLYTRGRVHRSRHGSTYCVVRIGLKARLREGRGATLQRRFCPASGQVHLSRGRVHARRAGEGRLRPAQGPAFQPGPNPTFVIHPSHFAFRIGFSTAPERRQRAGERKDWIHPSSPKESGYFRTFRLHPSRPPHPRQVARGEAPRRG